jgi:hypothetical protein
LFYLGHPASPHAENTLIGEPAGADENAFADRRQLLQARPQASTEYQIIGSTRAAWPIHDPPRIPRGGKDNRPPCSVTGGKIRRSRAYNEIKKANVGKSALTIAEVLPNRGASPACCPLKKKTRPAQNLDCHPSLARGHPCWPNCLTSDVEDACEFADALIGAAELDIAR